MEEAGARVAFNNSYVLDSGKLRMEFRVSGENAWLASLKGSGGREWLSNPGAPVPLWEVTFAGPNGADIKASSTDAALRSVNVKLETGGISLWWLVAGDKPDDLAGYVILNGRCERGSTISYWALEVRLAKGWKATRADFPMISNVKITPGLKLAAPAGWGVEYSVDSSTSYEGTYPSCLCAMQFSAFYSGGSGLYIGAHDTQANHKVLSAKAEDKTIAYSCTNWPPIPDQAGGTYRIPYETAIGIFEGDYYDAAQIYREFTFNTVWGKSGPVSERPIPQWVKDTDLWLKPGADPGENIEACKKAAELFDVPISLHWYRWHQIPYDTLYPDYFPAKPGFAEGVKALQGLGLHVMPYINGRLCDPESVEWREEGAANWAAKQENGEPYTEIYGSKVPLNAMCPYTTYWQDKVVSLVEKLLGECGVDGVYIDQIGAAHAYRCFNPAHGHPVGGGRFWYDGYRKLLNKARERLPEDRMLTTEENAECWIDQFDALLLVNTPTNAGNIIPLFPSVYSGRTITFGSIYIVPNDFEQTLAFRIKMARAFVWGSQIGWVDAEKMVAPELAKEAEFVKNLARCRSNAHDYLLNGQFLGMLEIGGNNPRVKGEGAGSFGGTYQIDMPAVLGSVWLAEDGTLGVALANVSDDPHEVEVRLPFKRAGMTEGKAFTFRTFGPDGLISSDEGKSPVRKIRIGGGGAAFISTGP